jgi:hypothetical protein
VVQSTKLDRIVQQSQGNFCSAFPHTKNGCKNILFYINITAILCTNATIFDRKILKYGFCKKSPRKYAPLTSWTLFSSVFFQISTDLEKNGGKKCSTGQRCIFPRWLITKSIRAQKRWNTAILVHLMTHRYLFWVHILKNLSILNFFQYSKCFWYTQKWDFAT